MTKKIPHKIHQIWVGPNPIPTKSKKFMKHIKELHPDFEYKLWTDKDITKENFDNYEYIKNSKSYAQKADIMRYEILYNNGGIYLDIDFEIYKNLEPLLINELVVCTEDMFSNFHITNAFIGCTKHNANLKRCVDGIKKINFSQMINVATGPVYFRKNIHMNKNVTLLEPHILYPVHWLQHKVYSLFSKPKYDKKSFSEETYGMHHWDHNW
uniref:Glycosyltransferase n=1 Tax=viral metagenome TaxID=1070528 RepID=A0A6C0D5X1_9ZZZZ